MFELSASDIKSGITLTNANSYPGIVFDGATDENGNCDVGFTLTGENISSFVLHFDKTTKEHATLLSVDGKQFENKKDSFAVVGLGNKSQVTVKILKWSKPFHHVKITSLSLSFTEEFDKGFIKELERNSTLFDDNKKPDYGISVQSGKLVLQDKNSEILDLAKSRVLRDGLNFELIFNGRTIGTYFSNNLQYNSTDDEATIDLLDDIVNLQEEIFIDIDFPTVPSEVVPLSALEILTAFYPKVFQMDDETETHLSSIIVAYPRMEKQDIYKSLKFLAIE